MAPIALPAVEGGAGAIASFVGKSAAMGGASFGIKKVLEKISPGHGDDDGNKDGKDDKDKDDKSEGKQQGAPEQQATPAPAVVAGGPAMAQPSPMVMAAPAVAGAGAGYAMAGGPGYPAQAAAPQVAAVAPVQAPAPAQAAPTGSGAHIGSFTQNLLAAGAGGLSGFLLKGKQAEKEGLAGGEKTMELAKGTLAGAGSGFFASKGFDAIQAPGQGMEAGLNTGLSAALASTLKEGGPGMLSSFGMGAGAGSLSNLGHDKLEEQGRGGLANAVSAVGMGSALGYTTLGSDGIKGLLGASKDDQTSVSPLGRGAEGMTASNPLAGLLDKVEGASAKPDKDLGMGLG